MTRSLGQTPNFEGWRAAILHRPHEMVKAMTRQLERFGIRGEACWPNLLAAEPDGEFDILFFDADMGHESQFCWGPGEAPIPTIALIGSEAPGRVAWAIAQGADAHLLKPVGSAGIYAAILLATKAFEKRQALVDETEKLRARLSARECVAAATAQIMMSDNVDAGEAYRRLRLMAMRERRTIEVMSAAILKTVGGGVARNDSA